MSTTAPSVDDIRKTYRLHPGPFYINPKLPLVRDRKQCNFTGMRKIKSKAGGTLGC
jgi:hypothetical protein